ncbi:mitochondrial division protein [Pseudohyphozyma bogoriensis]|nr:mitochondrial division protein [Pseudohyphozyma bogoriensis]
MSGSQQRASSSSSSSQVASSSPPSFLHSLFSPPQPSSLLADLAPQLLQSKIINSPAFTARPPVPAINPTASLRGKLGWLAKGNDANSLLILERVDELLAMDVPPAPFDLASHLSSQPSASTSGTRKGITIPAPDEQVPLIRGFQATTPAAQLKKVERRRKRAGLGELALGLDGKLGLKERVDKARGLLADVDEFGELNINRRTSAGKRRKTSKGADGKRDDEPEMSVDELVKEAKEVEEDMGNVAVRRSLLNTQISEVEAKIAALDSIREGLRHGLLGLREEELELEDELQGINERISIQEEKKKGRAVSASSRRRKGPAFLPSEHDELPPGLAFMTLNGHIAPITALDFSEPYGVAVTASLDESVRLWDLTTGDEMAFLRGHSGVVKALQVESSLCVTGGADGQLRIWDLDLAESGASLPLETPALDAVTNSLENVFLGQKDDVFGGGSTTVNGGAEEGMMKEESGRSGAAVDGPCVKTLDGHTKAVTSLYFDGSCLVTGSSDRTLRQWDLQTGQCVLTMDILWAISNPLASQTLSSEPEETYSDPYAYATPTSSPRKSLGDLRRQSSSFLGGSGGFGSSPTTTTYADGSWEMYEDFVGGVQFWGYALASGTGDGCVRMWDTHRTLVGHTGPVTCVQFDEYHLVSGSLDKSIRIWDLRTGSISDTIRYDHPITGLQFDSRKIVAAAGENGVRVFNRTTLQHSTLSVNGHTSPVERLRFMDRYLATGGRDCARVYSDSEDDLPPRQPTSSSRRRRSLAGEIRGTVNEVIHDAEVAGAEFQYAGEQINKAASFARNVESAFDEAYPGVGMDGDEGQTAGGRRSRSGSLSASRKAAPPPQDSETESESEAEQLLKREPYRPPRSTVSSAAYAAPPMSGEVPSRPSSRSGSRPSSRAASTKSYGDEKRGPVHVAVKEPSGRSSFGVSVPKNLLLDKISSFADVQDYEAVIDETDQLLDDASRQLGEIKYRRQQMVNAPYTSGTIKHKHVHWADEAEAKSWKASPNRQDQSADEALHDAKWMISLVTSTQNQLKKAYRGLRLVKRHSPAKPENSDMGLDAGEVQKMRVDVAKLQSTFNGVLKQVQDLAQEEGQEAASGVSDQRVIRWIHLNRPDLSDGMVLKELKKAKKRNASRDLELGLGSLDILQNPFTEINKTVIYINRFSTGISSNDPWPPASQAQHSGGLLGSISGMFGRGHAEEKPKKSKSRKRSSKKSSSVAIDPNFYEIGHESGRSKKKKSSSKRQTTQYDIGSAPTPKVQGGSDSETAIGPDGKKVPLGPDGLPLAIGYRVPTDDPNDSESYSDIVEDAREKVRNEHLFIPLTIFFWVCIFSLLIYWGVSKLLGNENPLGDELFAFFGAHYDCAYDNEHSFHYYHHQQSSFEHLFIEHHLGASLNDDDELRQHALLWQYHDRLKRHVWTVEVIE